MFFKTFVEMGGGFFINLSNFSFTDSLTSVYVKSRNAESTARVAIEIVAPSLTLIIEKFNHRKPNANGLFSFFEFSENGVTTFLWKMFRNIESRWNKGKWGFFDLTLSIIILFAFSLFLIQNFISLH